ncbi:hypothetical protein, partial [Klebsiella pneumoniae]|uniref:hypothetical protein n=1 Tax=Klebsiella pneumoniae TaxID=573 RepID=UPI0040559269
ESNVRPKSSLKVDVDRVESMKGKMPKRNIVHIQSRSTPETGYPIDPLTYFHLFFTDSIIEEIV